MARNAVQFQKGLSEPAFDRQYGTEEQCRAVVIAACWLDGFWCPACGGREHSMVAPRDLFHPTAVAIRSNTLKSNLPHSEKLEMGIVPGWRAAGSIQLRVVVEATF